MATYKSITAAIKALAKFDKAKLGKAVKDEIQDRITNNQVKGDPLTKFTQAWKTANNTTKLLEYGQLRDSIEVQVIDDNIYIGYTTELHHQKNRIGKEAPITLAKLAEVHNEGMKIKNNPYTSRVPKRVFLFEDGEWLETTKETAEKFYNDYLKSKDII